MVTRKVDRVVKHKNYNAATFNNDIALLRLDQEVKLGKDVNDPSPVCLPAAGKTISSPTWNWIILPKIWELLVDPNLCFKTALTHHHTFNKKSSPGFEVKVFNILHSRMYDELNETGVNCLE